MSRRNYSSRAARVLPALAFTLVITLTHPGRNAIAAAGDLDTSFDSDGKLTTDFFAGPDGAGAVAVQPDGKIVVVGSAVFGGGGRFAVARYNSDGSLDQAFGAGGKVTTEFLSVGSTASAVVVQPDGKIVVAGSTTEGPSVHVAAARYNPEGSLDHSFGAGGKVTTRFFDVGSGGGANAVALQPDGKIVIAGHARGSFALARYRADGTLDPLFGSGTGKVVTPFGRDGSVNAVAVQPDGKIVAAGAADGDFAVARYETDGTLDRTFNTGGLQAFTFARGFANPHSGEVSFDRAERATAVALYPDGRILLGGSVQATPSVFSPALARLRPDGQLDATFSGNGLAIFRQSPALDRFSVEQWVGLALQPNGKAVATAHGVTFNALRVNLDGELDQTFGGDGIVETDFDPDRHEEAMAVAVRPDGRIVVVGTSLGVGSNRDFAVARYLGDAPDVRCLYGLARPSHVAPAGGDGGGRVEVFAPAGCAWTAASNAPWIGVTPAAGSGNGAVSFTVEPTAGGLRTGTVTIAGQTFTVAQGGFKVAVYYGGGQGLAEQERARLAAAGLFAQVDGFTVHRATTPTLAHLNQYDAVYYFHNQISGPPRPSQSLFGDALADYVFQGRGLVVAGFNWSDNIGDQLTGNIRLFGWLPFTPDPSFPGSSSLVKLQPAHPVLEGVSAVESGLRNRVGLSQGAERIADWADGVPAVPVTRPAGGRVVGLNLFPPTAGGADATRLLANSLRWAAGAATQPPTFFEFGVESVTVSEGAGGADVTVSRAGDLSATSSAVFSTEETSAPARCDANTGSAYAHCDFETTVVALHFAAGEAQKTVRVPVIDDGHAEGQESVRLRVESKFGAQPFGDVATLVITDDDAPNAPNPFFDHRFFVRQHYLDFLSREPEPSGLAAWASILNDCPNVEDDPACDRATVSAGFFRADEFARKGYYVFRFYRAAFGRLPAYAEIVADMQAVGGATPAEVAGRRAAFAEAFTERAEFLTTRAQPGTTAAAYVNALMDRYNLQTIHTPDPANPEGGAELSLTRADLGHALTVGTLTRGQVLRAVVESREVDAVEFNPAFVAMQYYGYLRRAPEQPGYTNWLNYLNANPSDFRTMIRGFVNSVEYRLRFGRP